MHAMLRRILSVTALAIASLTVADLPSHAGGDAASLTVREAVSEGWKHEQNRRWNDAIGIYEKALRDHPREHELIEGLRRSRVHFSVERRYSDKTYTRSLLAMPSQDAMEVFRAVYESMQKHYIEPTATATPYTAHGTESLYFALNNERFLEHNVTAERRADAPAVRRILRDQYWNRSTADLASARRLINEVASLCKDRLGIAPTAVVMEYVFGGCNSLDDYSGFLSPGRYKELTGNIEGEFVGIGIVMKGEADAGVVIREVLPKSPAEEGGLKSGDRIIGVNGVDCRKKTLDETASLLQGQPGSRVNLEVLRGGEPFRTGMTRRAVTVKSIPEARIIDSAAGVGYIRMTSFQQSTTQEFDSALLSLNQQGMRSLVWDLRGNPGGLLDTAAEVLDRLIPEGNTLVTTEGRLAEDNSRFTSHRGGKWNMPLVVLVDGDSASASEIVAGAIRDHRRGWIVGRRTYGKWSVQRVFGLGVRTSNGLEKCGLRLTVARFYSPNHQHFSKVGLAPHFVVQETRPENDAIFARNVDPATDPDLQKALEVLRRPDFASR